MPGRVSVGDVLSRRYEKKQAAILACRPPVCRTYQRFFRFTALEPLASGWMSKDTFWPSDNEFIPAASSAVAWTNTSLAPPSGEMKPKPLDELKNFTVPIVMMVPLPLNFRTNVGKAKTSSREVSGPGARNASRDWRFFWSSRSLHMGIIRNNTSWGDRNPYRGRCIGAKIRQISDANRQTGDGRPQPSAQSLMR